MGGQQDSDDIISNSPIRDLIWPQMIGYLQRVGADEVGPESAGSMEALAGGAAEVGAEPAEAGACSVGLQHRKG